MSSPGRPVLSAVVEPDEGAEVRATPAFAGDEALLQQLIDSAVGPSMERGRGGIWTLLHLPAGRYVLHDSLRLRSNLQLVGNGTVILEPAPVVQSALRDIVGYGHSEFRVAEPHLFRPGMGVSIATPQTGGFGTTVGRIIAQKEDTFFIDVPFARDYRPREGAVVTSLFPLVAGYGVQDVVLDGVILDGGGAQPGRLDGCRGGGVYLLGCQRVEIQNVTVQRYPGDAISFQQCVDVWIRNCHLHDNAGHGMHPGSGSVRYVLSGNRIHNNGACGIYYCLRTTHSICRDNDILANGAEGITIGERDTDHLLEDNRIRGNARAGLAFRAPQVQSGDRVIVRGNHFADNQRAGYGGELEIGPRLRSVHVLGNRFETSAPVAVRVDEQCGNIVLHGNRLRGDALSPEDVRSGSAIQWQRPATPLDVTPYALPLDGARHLRIARLETWQDRPLRTTGPGPRDCQNPTQPVDPHE